MSRLKVNLRGAMISEIELRQDKEYTGGRRDGCDIRLQAEKGISREHFKLKFAEGRWNLQAISRFGDIFSLGQKIEEMIPLDHGQSFQVPPYEFQFIDVPESDVTSALPNDVLNVVSENEKTVIGAAPQVPYLKLINLNGDVREMLRLEVGDIWVAGRDPSCQIVIPDQRVSRRQFEIHKVNGNYTIIDLGSVNGTFLNGSPVSSTDPQTLKSGDAITVLDNTMYFELHDPNFKYKVERIEVPPIQFEQPSNDDQFFQVADNAAAGAADGLGDPAMAGQLPMEIPEIPQDQYNQAQYNPQMDQQGGVFTGMPPGSDPNQYYTFNQQPPPPQQAPVTGFKKFLQNKPMVAIVALLILGGAFYLSEVVFQEEAPQQAKVTNPNDPLSKLTPEQQSQVKELYSIGEQMYSQDKYELAIDKFTKLHQILPEGYLNSKDLLEQSEQAEGARQQTALDEERQRKEQETQEMIAKTAQKCEALLTPDLTVGQMQECLSPIAQYDVSSPAYVRLMAEAEKLQRERELKEEQAKLKAQEEADLVELFAKAEEIQKQGLAFKAIKMYQNVIASSLPDPKKLKAKSQDRIKYIEEKIAEKTGQGVSKADEFVKAGNLKRAIESLRETLAYDPQNKSVKQRIETYREELKRQSREIYHDAIIDESYGVVESTETRQGAKDKWKRIVDLDIDDGEYYKKAVIKLRRYGVY